jgi:general secretion pathway protein F
MQFDVRWVAPHHTFVSQARLDAPDEATLREHLAAGGATVLSVERRSLRGSIRSAVSVSVSDRLDVSAWCRELATLLRAGMTAVEAIEALQLHETRPGAAVVSAVLQALREGRPLSQAMQGTGAFPQVLVAGVVASERTSRLADALDDYLRYDTQLVSLRRQALSAAVYPAVVVAVGLLIALFLLTFVMPRFSRMYAGFRGQASGATQAMLWLSAALTQSLPAALAVAVALAAAVAVAWRRGWILIGLRAFVHAFGPLRRARDDFVRAQLFQALMLTLRGGYPFVEALRVCESLRLDAAVTARLGAARAAIERGDPPSRALAAEKVVDALGERLLRVGERGGQFEQVLQTLAQRHADAFATFVQRATRLVEPLLLLAVAVMVGGIVIMMYLPIFDIASGLH